MKKILLLLIISSFSYAQELVINSKGDSILLNQNGTWNLKEVKAGDFFTKVDYDNSKIKDSTGTLILKKSLSKDGAGNDVTVDFSIIINDDLLSKYGTSYFDLCTDKALNDVKYNLKNKYTFIPREIKWYFVKNGFFKNNWQVSINYSAQNDFGALKDGDTRIVYDSNCNEVN